MSWNSFPKAWKTIHVVTETFTQRRSECKFYLLHTLEYSFLSSTNEICFFRTNYHFEICSEVFFNLFFVF